ncbi:hypothetical protein PHYSODRAFT_469654 [Phytophthora sojae]|uniref:Uncharacterized protein n=1 Tax=Phytophthora sojae (strain P6497) TaxID=1094619 RepID=G4YKG6_PHYSP|nr:hypothetical protein PHYSODRAFT_469654 [Phytophthora sojae]EGZ28546.1 hypothetical protein PHYSODRAFT_469654 [Phytophthora sojae]|eukprot:XP_009515821.1 hypothetical protein PHYSODRAFT_469654 [Phytophthora sojae]
MELTQELVKKKVELLEQQKAKAAKLNELLDAPGGFNEVSRKTCKNLEAAITASKRPGYFAYYEQPENVKNVLRTGGMQRLQEQIVHLQKQIDQLTEKIEKSAEGHEVGHTGITITSLKHWLATYGTPKPQSTSDLFTVFTPDKKVYGGTAHYSAFRTQASTMKKGRLTK